MTTQKAPNGKSTAPAPIVAKAKKERGEGPAAITYVDKAGKSDYSRVPLDVTAVAITAKGQTMPQSYNVSELPASIKDALVAFAFSSRVKVYLANHANPDGSDAIKLATQVFEDLKSGKVYSRSAEGGKPGKKFDGSMYANAWKAAYKFMASKKMKKKDGKEIKELTETEVADLQASLEAMAPKERGARLKAFKDNKFYEKALAQLKAQAIDMSGEVSDEMPF